MTIENLLTETHDQLAETAAAYHSKIGDINAEVLAAQSAYNTFASNLTAIVNSQMNFSGIVDPDESNPTNVNGGTFLSIKELIDAAPLGASVEVKSLVGKEHIVDTDINISNKFIHLTYQGDINSGKPTIKPLGYNIAGSGLNALYGFIGHGYRVQCTHTNILLPTSDPDPNTTWSHVHETLFLRSRSGDVSVSLNNCNVTGGPGTRTLGILSGVEATRYHLGLYVTSIDGVLAGVVRGADGVGTIARTALTLQNGASVVSGGTQGTHYLMV